MSISNSFLLDALLKHNYLPTQRKNKEELPPIFNTESFTSEAAHELSALPYRTGDYKGYDQVDYKLTRFNNIPRILSIPHPLPYANLCLKLFENWDKINHVTSNPNSQIKPQAYADGRILIMNGYSDSTEKASNHINNEFGKHYRVCTDISNCFPSIYTHAVSWGLVGEKAAKKSVNDHAAWFNLIDKHLRSCKRNETLGVAIGPATSNIFIESMLSTVDDFLRKKYSYTRYIDDYTCSCSDESEAENFLLDLQKEVTKLKLSLNIRKTHIQKLPSTFTDDWVIQLSNYAPHDEVISAFDAYRYLDFAVSLSYLHPEASVLKYASSIIASKKCEFGDDVKILNYLLNLAFHYPALLPSLSKLIKSSYITLGNDTFDLNGTTTKLNRIVIENARLNRSDGMCWALYFLGIVGAKAAEETVKAVLSSADALAILTLYWTFKEHKAKVVEFIKSLNEDEPYELDRYWTLLYQLYKEGEINNPYNDEVFAVMRKFEVSFLLGYDQIAH